MRPRGPLSENEVRQWLEIFFDRLKSEDDTVSAAIYATQAIESRKWALEKLLGVFDSKKLPPNVESAVSCVLDHDEWRNGYGQTFDELLAYMRKEGYQQGYKHGVAGKPSIHPDDEE